jgi:hypothetical protein
MFAKTLTTVIVTATVLCGCNPDETKVTVKASALKSAVEGKVATAKVEMRLDSTVPFESKHPERIRRAALPFLGKDAEIRIEAYPALIKFGKGSKDPAKAKTVTFDTKTSEPDARFTAVFDIPVGTASALQKAPPSILQLEYDPADKTFRLVYGRNMSALNSALMAIGGGYWLEYSGGYIRGFLFSSYKTTVNILNDDVITLGVAAVAVNGKSVIAGSVDTRASSLLIDYGNKIYQGKAPCFMYGGFQTMSSRSPASGAKGN